MHRSIKIHACLTVLLAVLFYLFWDFSKHQPALAQVNVFADDPYDAVGSFGVQFALLTALLSLLRAFRPSQVGSVSGTQIRLCTGAAYLTYIAIAVVLLTDGVAMVRHLDQWTGSPAGYALALLIGGLGLLTLALGWSLHHASSPKQAPLARQNWIIAPGISLASLLILGFYPENWRQSFYGELFTACAGMLLFFIATWGWGRVVAPAPGAFFEDTIDDLAAMCRWLAAHASPFNTLFRLGAKMRHWPLVSPLLDWLNPRRHAWHGIILAGIVLGALLALLEALGEGGPGTHFALILAIFVGIESIGVLTGYALFRKPLGLFRHVALQRS